MAQLLARHNSGRNSVFAEFGGSQEGLLLNTVKTQLGAWLADSYVSFYTENSGANHSLSVFLHPSGPTRRGGKMRRYSAAGVLAALVSVIFLSMIVGCSGTSSTVAPVTQIVFTPTSLSLNAAQVVRLIATPENSTGGAVVADVSFSSSNTAVVTVSPAGFVCAGVWDSNYIVCNPNPGLSAVGQATITATSGSVTNTAQVNVHLQADRIAVNPISGCVSMGATPTYTATVYNTTVARMFDHQPLRHHFDRRHDHIH